MSEVPETIWAGRTDGFGGWHEGPDFVNNVEYVRADLVEARIAEAVKAEREAFLEAIELCIGRHAVVNVEEIVSHIRQRNAT